MAIYYVWSGATGAANGTSWANAYVKLATAVSGKAAGDTFYLAHDHSETTAGVINFFFNGDIVNPDKVICVNRGGSVPPVAADRRATAQIATSSDANIQFNSSVYCDGVIFVAGNATGAAQIQPQANVFSSTRMDNCSMRIGSTGNGLVSMITATSYVELNNCTVSFSAVGQSIWIGTLVRWRNTASALIGTAVPTTLFKPVSSAGGELECVGVDLSAAGSGKTIVASVVAGAARFRFIDCKLSALVTKSAAPTQPGSHEVDFVRCAAAGNYSVFRHRVSGSLTEETTIVRTGGATDGTTPISWKAITTANCSYLLPFECPPIAIWNDATGSAKTATIEGIWGGGAVPLDSEIWVDVEYLGDASSPQGSFVNDGMASLLATAANQTSSSATWGGSTTKFKLAVTFTPQQRGWLYARVKIAKASSTFYLDPLITLT